MMVDTISTRTTVSQNLELAQPGRQVGRTLTNVALLVFLIVVSLIALLPFYFMISGSLMGKGEMFKIPPHLWPDELIWENYRELFRRVPFVTYMRNSILVSVAQTAGVLFFSSLIGYVFAKRQFPGKRWLFYFVLITALLPNGQTTIIPFYLLMVKFDWVNTFWPLIIPWWAPPLSIFLMRQYIAAGVPDELIDASKLDGDGMFGTYRHVVLPLIVPGLVVVGILQFIAIWNEFLYGLLVLKTNEMRTLTVALTEMSTRTQQATLYGPLFAGIVLATLPMIILFFVFQRRLTQGILSGALRG